MNLGWHLQINDVPSNQILMQTQKIEKRNYLSIRVKIFSDDMTTTGISLKTDDSCLKSSPKAKQR